MSYVTELFVMAKSANLSVRVDPALLKRLNIYARANGKSVKDIVVGEMEAWLNRQMEKFGQLNLPEEKNSKRKRAS